MNKRKFDTHLRAALHWNIILEYRIKNAYLDDIDKYGFVKANEKYRRNPFRYFLRRDVFQAFWNKNDHKLAYYLLDCFETDAKTLLLVIKKIIDDLS